VELLDAAPDKGARGRASPLGGSKSLTSDGIAGSVPNSDQSAVVVELIQAEPRAWVISMNGIAPLVTDANGFDVLPFAKFVIEWGQQAAILKTEVDAYSDQYLTVFGNFVRVSVQWDLDEFRRVDALVFAAFGLHLRLPTLLRATVAIAPGEGAVTMARRTFICVQDAAASVFTFPVPLAATEFLVRDPSAGAPWLTNGVITWQVTQNVTTAVDVWDPIVNLVTHSFQKPGQLPSLANFMSIQGVGAPVGATAYLEFTLRP